jgi:cytosine/adenosine deaminase-related metal-dependent hydrolase
MTPLPRGEANGEARGEARGEANGGANGGKVPAATVVIDGCAIATVDGAGTEYDEGHLVIAGDRLVAVGAGPAPANPDSSGALRRVDGSGCLATPGLVNTHHHFSQWITRGLAQQEDLFGWLRHLYPIWAHIDSEMQHAAALASIAAMARSGCTTTTDHQYIFPAGAGDLFAAEVHAARQAGVRFHPTRGSMDLGQSSGGLPPDSLVEDRDGALAATDDAISRYHDPGPAAMLQVGVAPCSPFSVTRELMVEAAELARRRGVRLHTHLAETVEEQEYCAERFGCSPVQYAEQLGWLGDDVWLAHGVHLDGPARERLAATGTGVAHCPSSNARLGSGIAPVPELLAAGAPVGLGVDGTASNESGELGPEVRMALLVARARGGPSALTTRQALWIATAGGARCLGRHEHLGSLEPGKLADVALWRVDTAAHAGVADPVAALVLAAPAPLELLLVGGRPVVEHGVMTGVDADELAGELRVQSARLRDRQDRRAAR